MLSTSWQARALSIAHLVLLVTASPFWSSSRLPQVDQHLSSLSRRTTHHPVPASRFADSEDRQDDDLVNYIVTSSPKSRRYGLRNSESFYWGLDGDPLTKLTTYAREQNVKVLSLERFDDVLESAKCSNSSVYLTADQEEFEHIKRSWSWVNDHEENHVIFVTENSRCNMPDGDPTIRQPWHVSKAQFNAAKRSILLDAKPVTWANAFSDWRLQISSRGLLPTPTNTTTPTKKRFTVDAQPTIDLGMDLSGLSLSSDGGEPASISCVSCSTYGNLDFDIDVTPYILPETKLSGHFAAYARGVGATFDLQVAVSGQINSASFTETPWSWTPSGLGINIPGVVDLGPTLKFVVAGSIGSVSGSVAVTGGLQIGIPDDSVYYKDFDDSSQDQNYDWAPWLVSEEPDVTASLSIAGSVGTQLRLELDAEVLGVGGGIALVLAAPTLQMQATALFDENGGVCGQPAAQEGVEVDYSVGASLDAVESAGVLGIEVAATQTLGSWDWPVATACVVPS